MRARSVFVSLLIIICASISCNGRNNIVGRVSCEGKGIKGVVVSDGISTVQSDSATPTLPALRLYWITDGKSGACR
jgi:hypothetical protein